MTRLLLTGDNHLGKGQDLGRLPGERLAEQEQVWRSTLELARERSVDAVLHAGDLFDGRRPGPDVMLAAERPLVEHRAAKGCLVFVIAGNHDVPSQDGACGLDVLAEAGLIELAREPLTWPVWDLAADPQEIVRVHALPWTPVSRLVAMADGGDRAEISALAADLLLETARGLLAAPRRKPGRDILLGHWSVSQTSLPNGIDVGSLGGVVLPMDDLVALGFDALVFGHIHREQQVGSFLYVGSPQPLDFGEGNDAHGVWFLDTDAIGAPEFVALESAEFVTLDLTDGEVEEMASGVMPALAPALRRYLKIRYAATEEQARRIDTVALRSHADEYGPRAVFIEASVERAHRERGQVLDQAGSRIDQLAAYLEAVGVNGDTAPAMLARAESYIS